MSRCSGTHWTPDHPRSRGVDSIVHELCDHVWGSSPLARGRQPDYWSPAHHVRIIPARAGSTVEYSRELSPPGDHPRSRGVDRRMTPLNRAFSGSSPLARGRPPGDRGSGRPELDHPRSRGVDGPVIRRLGTGVGIIPARAGSTLTPCGLSTRSRDHPRSRGVDLQISVGLRDPQGSSPLARGRP